MSGPGRLLGLDLGSKRIGVAVSDDHQAIATGVSFVTRSADRASDHRAVAALVADYDAVGVVVGVPYALSGRTGPAAAAVLDELSALRSALAVPVHAVDERLTTVVASGALRAGGRAARRQRAVIDQSAAAVILQTWLDQKRAGVV